jgi:hypothetical protein
MKPKKRGVTQRFLRDRPAFFDPFLGFSSAYHGCAGIPAPDPPPALAACPSRFSNRPNRIVGHTRNRRQNTRSILPHGLQQGQNAAFANFLWGQVRDIKAQRLRHG